MRRRIWLFAAAGLVVGLVLTGCSSTANGSWHSPAYTSVPEPAPTVSGKPIAEGMVKSVLVSVFAAGAFNSNHGCRCTLKGDQGEELFPAGTPVVLLKVTLTGIWGPAQGTSTTQDVSGTSLNGTRFEGRPELAQLATKDGTTAAARLGLPWLPEGVFKGRTWTISNNRPTAFAAAWFLPRGVDTLDLSVNVPSEGEATTLAVKLPGNVLSRSTGAGE